MGVDVTLRIGVLGPFEVEIDGQPVVVSTGRLRSLLAVLAMAAGRTVLVDSLIDAVWGSALPNNARRVMQVYVTRLRSALGAERIGTVSRGYVLNVDPDNVDALRFERLLDAAMAEPDPATQRAALADALGLWRGTPFE